jgi:hypothetical protein
MDMWFYDVDRRSPSTVYLVECTAASSLCRDDSMKPRRDMLCTTLRQPSSRLALVGQIGAPDSMGEATRSPHRAGKDQISPRPLVPD